MNLARLLSLTMVLSGVLTSSAHAVTYGTWQHIPFSAPANSWGPASKVTHALDVCEAYMSNAGWVWDQVSPGVATGGADPRSFGGAAVVMEFQKTSAPFDLVYYYAQFTSNNKKVWTFDANPNVGEVYQGYGDYFWTGYYVVECTQFGG